jgi:hypothetical protein
MHAMTVPAEPPVRLRRRSGPDRHVPYKHIVAVAFVLGLFMDILDTTIVNVALPTLRDDFRAD